MGIFNTDLTNVHKGYMADAMNFSQEQAGQATDDFSKYYTEDQNAEVLYDVIGDWYKNNDGQTLDQRLGEVSRTSSDIADPNADSNAATIGQALGGDGGGGDTSDLASLLDAFKLDKYEDNTDIPLTSGDQQAIDLAKGLMSGDVGNFRNLLEGTPDLGHTESLINIGKTRLREQVLPSIRDSFSQSPLGSGFNTGARREAESDAIWENFAQNQEMRADAFREATQNSLIAAGMVPQMANVVATERMNNIMNKERELAVFYKNQGLNAQEFSNDLAVAGLALQSSMADQSQANYLQQLQGMKDQQKIDEQSGIYGAAGSILGGLLGWLTDSDQAGGSQLGAGLGLLAGGSSNAGYQTIAQGINSYSQAGLLDQLFGTGTNTVQSNYNFNDSNYGSNDWWDNSYESDSYDTVLGSNTSNIAWDDSYTMDEYNWEY